MNALPFKKITIENSKPLDQVVADLTSAIEIGFPWLGFDIVYNANKPKFRGNVTNQGFALRIIGPSNYFPFLYGKFETTQQKTVVNCWMFFSLARMLIWGCIMLTFSFYILKGIKDSVLRGAIDGSVPDFLFMAAMFHLVMMIMFGRGAKEAERFLRNIFSNSLSDTTVILSADKIVNRQ